MNELDEYRVDREYTERLFFSWPDGRIVDAASIRSFADTREDIL